MLFRNAVFTSGVLAEKALLEEVGGFDETMGYAEDYNLWLRIACTEPLRVIGEKLLIYEGDTAAAGRQSLSSQPQGNGTGRAAKLPDAPPGRADRRSAVSGGVGVFSVKISSQAAAAGGILNADAG